MMTSYILGFIFSQRKVQEFEYLEKEKSLFGKMEIFFGLF